MVDYEKFGLRYRVGRGVSHLAADGANRTLCGLNRLGLTCKKKPEDKVCRNCRRDVTILKARRQKIAVYKGYSSLEAHIEMK